MALTDNLISWYNLDDDATDAVGNKDGAEQGSVGYDTGVINNGLDCDGTDDYVKVTNLVNDLSGDFSVSIWVKIADADKETFSTLWMFGDGANNAGANDDRVKMTTDGSTGDKASCIVEMGSPGTARDTSSDIADGAFHHIAFIWDDTAKTMDIYIDDSLEVNGLGGAGSIASLTDKDFTIGAGDAQNTQGIFDLVGVWDRQITAGEVTELFNGGDGLDPFADTGVDNSIFFGVNF